MSSSPRRSRGPVVSRRGGHRPSTLRRALGLFVSRARPRSRGQAIVELAIVLPVILVLLAAGADLARIFHSQVAIESAARAGALEASSPPTSFQSGQPCNTTSNRIMCAVITESTGSFFTIAPADVSLSCTPSPCAEALGNTVSVTVAGHFSMLTPILSIFFGGTSLTLTQTAAAQIATRPNITTGATPTPTPTPSPTPTPTPSPTPTPPPTSGPTPTPTPTPTSAPTPTPTPFCYPPTANFVFS